MTGPKARGTGVIERQTFRRYELTPEGHAVVGGLLAFHSTDGFPYDLTLDIFRERIAEGQVIRLQPYDLMYEMCALGLYDIGEEIGEKMYGDEWPEVYSRMKLWGAYHWTVAKKTCTSAGKPFDHDEVWSLMLVSMREELRTYLKRWKDKGKACYERENKEGLRLEAAAKWEELDECTRNFWRMHEPAC